MANISKRELMVGAVGAAAWMGAAHAKPAAKHPANTVPQPAPAPSVEPAPPPRPRFVAEGERGISLKELCGRLEKLQGVEGKGRFESEAEYKARVVITAVELGVQSDPAQPINLSLPFRRFESAYDADAEICRLGPSYGYFGSGFSFNDLQAMPNPWGEQQILASPDRQQFGSSFYSEMIEHRQAKSTELVVANILGHDRSRGSGIGLLADKRQQSKVGNHKFSLGRETAKQHFDQIGTILSGEVAYPFISKGEVYLFDGAVKDYQVRIGFNVAYFTPRTLTLFSRIDGRVFHQISFDGSRA